MCPIRTAFSYLCIQIMIDPILYSTQFPLAVWLLLAATFLCACIIASIVWTRLIRVRRRVLADDRAELPDEGYPPVSVIVYAHADAANLRTFLPAILEQDYPADMEVIVVNDESRDDTETVVSELEMRYPNLYMTFAPEESRHLSRRKLAITLGVKAARYNALLLTEGRCAVPSPLWMRSMMRHMSEGKEVVIGYALTVAPDGEPDRTPRRRRRSYDRLWATLRALSPAIGRHPFMADACNLAYTRRLFFERKGFSRTLHLTYGDDDVFIREIATPANTAVELSHRSRILIPGEYHNDIHDLERIRRDFTSRMLPRCHYISSALVSFLWWAMIAAAAVASLFGCPSLIPLVASAVFILAFALTYGILWRRTACALGERPIRFTAFFMALWRPARTLRYRLLASRHRSRQYTHTA